MEWITEPERKTTVVANVELLVCGGGFAGVSAAVCGARNGSEVLLLEKYGFLGGLVTSALVITTPPLNNGINSEIAKRLRCGRKPFIPPAATQARR
jgi:heterodisulfide reductase subunit A-like polyferredoxin